LKSLLKLNSTVLERTGDLSPRDQEPLRRSISARSRATSASADFRASVSHATLASVSHRGLALDPRFDLDFDTAFPSGPARPHGLAMK
jgi:hypothetical protein